MIAVWEMGERAVGQPSSFLQHVEHMEPDDLILGSVGGQKVGKVVEQVAARCPEAVDEVVGALVDDDLCGMC